MMIRPRAAILSCALAAVSVANLQGQAVARLNAGPTPDSPSADQTVRDPQLVDRYPRYVIQREDVILVSFPLSPEFNQTVTVQPDGYVNLENGKSVHVQGLTVPEMAKEVRNAYVGVLHEPIVKVDLEDFQRPFFTVTGQVGKPGQYELRNEITVSEALAIAGGLQGTGKTQIFLFRRTANSMFQVEKLKLNGMFNGKDVREDPVIRAGDMVYVPEKFITSFRKYVPYSVNAGWYMSGTP